MKLSATSNLLKFATDKEHMYWPTSLSETFVMCREKLPVPPGSHLVLTFLFPPCLIIWPLNFQTDIVSKGLTLRPKQTNVTLDPFLVAMLRWTGLTTGKTEATPRKRVRKELLKSNPAYYGHLISYGFVPVERSKESHYIFFKFNSLNTDTLLIRALSIFSSVL